MAVVNDKGIINLPCANEVIYEGYCYVSSSGNMTKTTTASDDVLIAVESSIDSEGAAKTLAAGQKMPFFVMGSGRTVKVASAISITYTLLCPVYLSTTDGLVDTTSSSATMIGHYVGPNNVATVASGDLIDVILDVPCGGLA